jgi:hypothetical protein
MTYVMQKSGDLNQHLIPNNPTIGETEGIQSSTASSRNLVEHSFSSMHHTKGMLESGVHGAWVKHVRPSELPNPPEALEYGMLDNISHPFIQFDKPVNWAAEFAWLCRQRNPF